MAIFPLSFCSTFSLNRFFQIFSLLMNHYHILYSQMASSTLKYFLFKSGAHIIEEASLLAGISKYRLIPSLHRFLFKRRSHGGLSMRIYKVNTSLLVFITLCGFLNPCLSWLKIGIITWVAFKNSFPWSSSREISYYSLPTYSLLCFEANEEQVKA